MAYDSIALAKHRLELAYSAIADSKALLKSGSPAGTVSMALRAGKEAAKAGLLAVGVGEVGSESLLFLLARFVKEGRLTARSFNAFRTIVDLYHFTCERDFSTVKSSEVSAALENLKYFIREMNDLVKR